MLRFLRGTWLPAVVFGLLSRLDVWDPRSGFLIVAAPTVTALVFVPVVWWAFVVRRGRPVIGRAALAGAAAGFVIPAAAWVIAALMVRHDRRGGSDGFGEGLGAILTLMMTAFYLVAGGPVGAASGAMVAWVQRRWLAKVEDGGEHDSAVKDGAIRAMLVALLAAPVVGVAVTIVLPESARPQSRHGGTDIEAVYALAWLVLVPLAGFAGARAAARKQLTDSPPASGRT